MYYTLIGNATDVNYWDFKGVRKEGIHILGKYPATMVAPMQKELISKYISSGPESKILDVFCGSGTTLVESQKLGMSNSIGIDINPYAILLSEVKTTRFSKKSIDNSIKRIKSNLEKNDLEYTIHKFDKIEKWFRQDVIDSLSKIKQTIENEKIKKIRKFYWVCLSEVIYKYSNDRTSTFKLHAKKDYDINNMINNCIPYFIEVVEKNSLVLNYSLKNNCTLYRGNVFDEIHNIKPNDIDIICTSPPYGDNHTTVTYGQFSILFLKWINICDLKCDEDILNTYSKIDSKSMGGNNHNSLPSILTELDSYNKFISNISIRKSKKIQNFFSDYFLFFEEMVRVLKPGGTIILTLGNRKVDGVEQPLDRISIEIAQGLKLQLIEVFNRNILQKNMPKRLSQIKNIGSVESMNKEYVLIFKKKEM